MLTKFGEEIGTKLAEQWLTQVLTPAFIFWAGLAGIWISRNDLNQVITTAKTLDAIEVGILFFGALIGIVISGIVMQQVTLSLLRLLQGYWPCVLRGLAYSIADFRAKCRQDSEVERSSLSANPNRNTKEHRRLNELEMMLYYTPADPSDAMPTTLGNILRFAETTPEKRYGLDAVVCWPRLWLLLPEQMQKELTSSRSALDQGVGVFAWGLLFTLFTPLTPWALVGLVIAFGAYLSQLNAAKAYADLIVTAFDLYRWELYNAVHWTLPSKSGALEIEHGKALTLFLWRGELPTETQYQSPPTN